MQNMKTIKPGTRGNRSYSLTREAVNVDERTVELAFSSEEPVDHWWGREILDHTPKSIRLGRLKSGAPLLADHNNSIRSQIGVVESVTIGADRVGRAVVRFGRSDGDDEIFQKVSDGIIRNVSVGYIVHGAKLTETTDEIDTYRIDDWEPLEISLVAVPADSSVGVGRSIDSESPVIFLETKKEGIKMSEEVKDSAEQARKQADEKARNDIAAERKRVADIHAISDEYGEGIQNVSKLAARAVQDGVSVQDFQKIILDARKTPTPEPGSLGDGARVKDNLIDDQKRGFRSLGDFASAIHKATIGRAVDERLTRAVTTFANESSGQDGGFAVPPEFATAIASIATSEQSLLSMTDNMTISGNTMSYPKDETTSFGTTGIYAAWEGEANQSTPKKPVIGEANLKLKKLKVLVAASDELLADASGMSSYLTRKMSEAVDWKIQDAIVNGSGTGVPLGIKNSGAVVSQAKETSQTADTINGYNVAKMLGRLIGGAGSREVWLINPDSYNQIITMTLNNNPVWTMPTGGFKDAPNGLLLGRQIVLTDACQTLGDKFDIVLANMAGYRSITKAGAAELTNSMHLWFDQDVMAFKLVFRMDGAPTFAAPITPPNSAVTRSHFVTLDARA